MSYALVYDTETTGLPIWREPSNHEDQPHLVQLAALLVDTDTREVAQSINLIIKPNGWNIPQEVTDVHGITHELAREIGVDEDAAVALLMELWDNRLLVAHNEPFDRRIIRIALKRYFEEADQDAWADAKSECTGKLSKSIMKMPYRGPGYKMPKLSEAYEHFIGEPLVGAHDALTDTQACLDLWFALKDQAEAA